MFSQQRGASDLGGVVVGAGYAGVVVSCIGGIGMGAAAGPLFRFSEQQVATLGGAGMCISSGFMFWNS